MDTTEEIYVIRDIESLSFYEGLNLALSDFRVRAAHSHTVTVTLSGRRFIYRLTTTPRPALANAQSVVFASVLDEISALAQSGSIVALSYSVKGDAVSLLLDTQ